MKKEVLYEGKAKIIYHTSDKNYLIQYFKDDVTAFNNQKKEIIKNKGIINNFISSHIMNELEKYDIPNHFIKRISYREQLIKKVKIIPIEVVIRNIAAGSIVKRLNLKKETVFDKPIFEIYYKEDNLSDPLINDEHAIHVLKLVKNTHLELIKKYSFKINKILKNIFREVDIDLVDFKMEFGFLENQQIILSDEISPDSCRLWDTKDKKILDKDVFRKNLGSLIESYQEVANRLNITIKYEKES